jgi:hypothetical protein
MKRSVLFVAALAAAALGCTSPRGDEHDAAAADGASSDAGLPGEDARATPDAAILDGARSDDAASAADATTASGAHPPSGTRLCAEGTLTQEALRATCASTDPIVLGVGIGRNCDALTTAGLDYEVWCSSDQLYLYARIREVDSASRLSCPGSVPLPDGGAIAYETRPIGYGIYSPPPDGSPIFVEVEGARFGSGAPSSGTAISWRETIIGDPITGTYERTISAWSRPEGGAVDLAVGGTMTFGLALAPVDCTGYTPTGDTAYVFLVRLGWDAPTT